MEADRKRRALDLLTKLEQGAYNPESNVYSMAALVIAGALGEPYKNPREPDTEKAALAAMYAYSADVHALADYVKELEQQAAAADASPFLNGIDYEPPELKLTEPEIELADFEFNPEFEPVEEEPARETPGGKLDRLIAELNTAYKESVAAHLQWTAALEEKARAATPADREQWEQVAAARRTVMAAKHQIAMNRIDRLREYSPEAADEWKPPRD